MLQDVALLHVRYMCVCVYVCISLSLSLYLHISSLQMCWTRKMCAPVYRLACRFYHMYIMYLNEYLPAGITCQIYSTIYICDPSFGRLYDIGSMR